MAILTLGPVTLDAGVVTMRSPRLRDAEAWSSARLANRKWLERAFPAWGPDWAAEQSPLAWVERCRLLARQRRHGACPFVVFLDGRLVGEIGVDAVDASSGAGEASAWLVADHGGPDVMLAASVLLIAHAFERPDPLDRMLSPVATTSRRGRSPGLSAVGFEIEATIPRPVGHGSEPVDHDMWVVHNTPDVQAMVAQVRTRLDQAPGERVPGDRMTARRLRPLVPAIARVGVRAARDVLRRRGSAAVQSGDDTIAMTTDVGTATVTLVPRPGKPADLVLAELERLADRTATESAGMQRVEVRLAPTVQHLVPGLAELGFTHDATYRANPDGPRGYPGEQVWGRPAR